MAITATDKSVERELVPEGTHTAICYSMIELGTKEEDIQGKLKTLHKARLEWELCDESFTYEKDGEQVTGKQRIGKDYTLSMNEKSNLRKDLTSWRGKAFTKEEAKEFDITVLLGVPCLIGIVHAVSGQGNKYAKISSITSLPKGMPKPEQHNPNFLFSFDDYKDELLEVIPDWLKDQIKESDEYKELKGLTKQEIPQESPEPESDLPF